MSDSNNANFIKEGSGDIETQVRNEEINRNVRELATRKSLSDQLRENSKKKRQQFQRLTKEKNSFTRVSSQDLNHLRAVKQKELEKLQDFTNLVEAEERTRVKRQQLLQLRERARNDNLTKAIEVPSTPEVVPKKIKVSKEKSQKGKLTLGIVRKRKIRGNPGTEE